MAVQVGGNSQAMLLIVHPVQAGFEGDFFFRGIVLCENTDRREDVLFREIQRRPVVLLVKKHTAE